MTMDEEGERRVSVVPILILIMLVYYGVAPFWLVASIGIWYYSLNYLEESGHLDSWNFDRVLGIILMARTKRGKSLLEYVSRNRKFWRGFGELSIWICFLLMAGVVYLLSSSLVSSIRNPPQEVLPATDILLIPGVTSFVPFWWPVLALVVALLIHEYSHGIQARAHGMEVRNFGLLLMGPLPVGAFAEPEHLDMSIAPRRERIRLYAAGPSINIVATFISLVLLGVVSSGFVAVNPGVHALAIIEDGGADEAGIMPYDIITEINGEEVHDYDSFSEQMSYLSAGDEASFTIIPYSEEGGESSERMVILGDRYHYYLDLCEGDQGCLEETETTLNSLGIEQGDAFLGVSNIRSGTVQTDRFSYIVDDRFSLRDTVVLTAVSPLIMLGTPMQHEGQTMDLHERSMLMAGDGALASSLGTEGMLDLFDCIFWMAWINFLLGFANLIPIIPFDGGHIVKDTSHSLLSRVLRGENPMKVEMLANKFSYYTTIVVLSIVVIPLIIPLFY
jgi:membrane-associated protease RseP (regulator of RpoE activity)|tara:strand:- start:5729 stop:7240 length:1512 start_codon:yes stop_codon:yes gene_type:complete